MGASLDGIIQCCCHDKCLSEEKCPYNYGTQLLSELEGNASFFLKQINEHLKLDKAHSYYYQVQWEIDNCYFVVWSPEEMYIEEVKRDIEFFSALLPAVNNFQLKGVLLEVIAHWFTKTAAAVMTDCNGDTSNTLDSSEFPGSSNNCTNNTVSKEMYCLCNGPDDGRRMILCENEHCSSGTWFHFECLSINI